MSTGETAREQSPQSFQHIPAKISPVLCEQLYLNQRPVRDTGEPRHKPAGGGPGRCRDSGGLWGMGKLPKARARPGPPDAWGISPGMGVRRRRTPRQASVTPTSVPAARQNSDGEGSPHADMDPALRSSGGRKGTPGGGGNQEKREGASIARLQESDSRDGCGAKRPQ